MMLTIAICLVIGVALAVVFIYKRKKAGQRGDMLFLIYTFGMSGLVVGLLATLILGSFLTYKESVISEKELLFVRVEKETAGTFFLGIGSLKDKRYYEFFHKSKSGEIEYNRLPIDTPVYQKDDLKWPVLRTIKIQRKFSKPWYEWFAVLPDSKINYEILTPLFYLFPSID